MPDPRTAELLRRLGSREPQPAWNCFLETYSALICQVVRWFERDPDDAADCFLFVCEQLSRRRFRRLRRFDPAGRASFPTWLRAVTRNLCLDWHRQRFGRYRTFQSVSRLPDFEQQVFHCVCEQGMSAEECAEALKPAFASVSSDRVTTSLQLLQDTLSPQQWWSLGVRRSRSQLRNSEAFDDQGQSQGPRDLPPDPESQAVLRETFERVQNALERLPPEDRLLLLLRFEQELTLAEVARLLALKDAQTADRRIQEVLGRLRERLGVGIGVDGKVAAGSV